MAATATFKQIRAGLVANLRSLGIQSTGYMLAEPIRPALEIYPTEVNYDQTFGRGLDQLLWTVRIIAAATLDVPAQDQLDEYLSPSGSRSVKTLLETDRSLGGVVQNIHVTEISQYQVAETKDGGLAWFATWTVQVYA
jgi:hypothetical protein